MMRLEMAHCLLGCICGGGYWNIGEMKIEWRKIGSRRVQAVCEVMRLEEEGPGKVLDKMMSS